MKDRSDGEQDGGIVIGRRSLLIMAVAAGVLTPLIGTGTAHAAQDSGYDIPEESGSIPWW